MPDGVPDHVFDFIIKDSDRRPLQRCTMFSKDFILVGSRR
jgi:hypothetical protein